MLSTAVVAAIGGLAAWNEAPAAQHDTLEGSAPLSIGGAARSPTPESGKAAGGSAVDLTAGPAVGSVAARPSVPVQLHRRRMQTDTSCEFGLYSWHNGADIAADGWTIMSVAMFQAMAQEFTSYYNSWQRPDGQYGGLPNLGSFTRGNCCLYVPAPDGKYGGYALTIDGHGVFVGTGACTNGDVSEGSTRMDLGLEPSAS